MWIKLLLSAAIVLFCTFLGYLAASKYRARQAFFAQMTAFNERYLNELTYARRALGELIGEFGENGDFCSLLKSRNKEIELSYLSEEEKKECIEYLKMLGTGDSYSQKNFFSGKTEFLSNKKTESEREARERGGLYLKLGLLAGLAFVILIV